MSQELKLRLLLAALGLSAATVVQAQTLARVSEFQYHPTTGLLTLERVDPGLPTCVETVYGHDAYGNRQTVTVQPCPGVTSAEATFPARITTNVFAASTEAGNLSPAGAYQTETRTATSGGVVLAKARASYDARFGTSKTQTEVALAAETTRSLTKRTEYDGFGRVENEYIPVVRNADGSVQETRVHYDHVYCQGPLATANAACLNLAPLSVPVTYASGRLTDASGNVASSASVRIVTAYFVQSTPYSGATVIGAKTRVHYDALHRQIAKETQSYDGKWVRTLTGFDALGQTAATWGAHFVTDGADTAPPDELRQWTAARDHLHRPTEQRQFWRASAQQTTAEQIAAQVTYEGLKTTATVPASSTPNNVERKVVTHKNASGQTARTVNADGATLDMAYDAVGNLVKTVDPLGYTTTITYTAGTARFKVGMTDPDQGSWTYAYDALGQLKSQTDARGKTTGMAYDELGRLTSKTTATLNAYWYHGKNEAGTWCAYGLNRPCESKTGNTTFTTRQSTGYDTLGRAVTSTSTLDRTYTSQSTFDTLGRLDSVTYPSGLRVNYAYSSGTGGKTPGVLERVSDNANAARVFWRIDTLTAAEVFDAQGHLLKATLGNGVTTAHVYDSVSGKALNLRGGTGGSNSNVYDQRYTYDKLHNLATRTEAITAVVETFAYDVLDRLTNYQLDSGSEAGASHTVALKYNALGNILEKGDVGGYAYSTTSRPHAVQSAGGSTYAYDANGNVTSTTGAASRTQSWTDFNLPDTLSYQGRSVAFAYDAGYKRVREVITDGAKVRNLYLVHPDNAGGLGYEREETWQSGSLVRNENRHYIGVGGVVVAVVKTLNSGSNPVSDPLNGTVSTDATLTQYWHKDSLGSVIAVSDATGAIERMAFDAWGRRLRDTGRVDVALNPAHGDRGYTGHEHLDEIALVHMNGRVYDPVLARFFSADPMLQSPEDLQNYNRYAYVLNNPLRYTDPTGQVINWVAVKVFTAIIATAMIVDGNKYWKMVGSIALAWAMGGGDGLIERGLGIPAKVGLVPNVANSMVSGLITSAVSSGGDIEAMAIGMMSAGAFTAVGVRLDGWARVGAHALIGCLQGAASGGKCGPSAASAAAGKWATGALDGPPSLEQFVGTVIAGGTASVIGGGKFANGAMQAAWGYLFNNRMNAFQWEEHHWHDRSITKALSQQGLLTGEAENYLLHNENAKTRVFQDVKDPALRVHRFDSLHRAATAEVREISARFVADEQISKENPMTRTQAARLTQQIRASQTPGITAYRNAFADYMMNRMPEAQRRYDQLLQRTRTNAR